ncbi:hypothetical protein [Maridesulfovibrio sp.]|uniref:hypothetical protein n=1 Tax=Maridesulfovibrio sp. TaxID=2795000 RepID=UPI0039EEECAE
MALTEDDFEYIKEYLSKRIYGRVKLVIDGYNITLVWSFETLFKRVIVTYINGELSPKWITGGHPECSYWRPVRSFKYDTATRKRMKKISKRQLKKEGWDPEEKRVNYSPAWSSFKTLFAHLKTFENAKLIRNED